MTDQAQPNQAPAGSVDGLGAVAGSILQQQLVHAQKILDQQHELVAKYVGEKIKTCNILNYNGANLAYNHARDTAAKLGLDSNGINPYPGTDKVVVVSNQETPVPPPPEPEVPPLPEKKKGLPTWASLLLGAGLTAAGGGALALPAVLPGIAAWIVSQAGVTQPAPEQKPVEEKPPVVVPEHKQGDVGFTIE